MNRREALTALVALPAAAHVGVADLQPDDVIVIEHPRYLSESERRNIKTRVGEAWPGRKVIVLDDGMTLKVARG